MKEYKIAELYKILLKNIPWPVWIGSTDNKVIFINNKYEETYGIKLEECFGKNIEDVFEKDKSETYIKIIKNVIEKSEVQVSSEIINGVWLECTEFPLIDDNDDIVAVAGIIIDINDRVYNEKESKKQANILRTIIDAVPETIFYKDNESRFIGYNKLFKEFYDEKGISDIIGYTDLDIYPDKEVAAEFIVQDREIMQEKRPRYYEFEIKDEHGNVKIEENVKIPVVDNEGEVWGIVGLSRDITERKVLEERLKYLSQTDILTGLYNRHSFEEKIKEFNDEKYLPLGIIMGDINGLKLVNDTIGHLEGDKLLKSISIVLKAACDKQEIIFRWGGDEFIILIPNYNEEKCEGLINKINLGCETFESEFIKLSIALGLGVKNNMNEDIYECIKKAEESVYRKKLVEGKSFKSSVMDSLSNSLENRNMETGEHTNRVINYALDIGKRLNFKISELDELSIAASFHDIGKIGISEDILLKPDRLTEEEFEIMKSHTEKGYRIINASTELYNVAKVVLTHHERWDGRGYPLGLKGEEIPLMSRIINIVDSYDVMISGTVYKEAISKAEAIEELKRCSGKQFDPTLVEYFIQNLMEN